MTTTTLALTQAQVNFWGPVALVVLAIFILCVLIIAIRIRLKYFGKRSR